MIRLLAAALVLTAWVGIAAAQPAAPAARPASAALMAVTGGPAWHELQPAQQLALAPLKAHWGGIDANRKSKWLAVAHRFASMSTVERQRVQTRMAEWAAMSPTERGRARQNFQELRTLRADDRQARWDAYSALPAEQKRELAQRTKPAPRPAEPPVAGGSTAKRAVPVNPVQVTVKPVTPTVVQAKPGASTNLVTKTPNPPAHHQPGLPKIAATAGFVNPTTLLPSRGPQGAAALSPARAPVATPVPVPVPAPATATAPASAAASEPGQ